MAAASEDFGALKVTCRMPFSCPDCHFPLPDRATFCPHCRPRVMCHRCGAPAYEKALVCAYCHQWLGNRRRGPFWWQAYGTHLSVGGLLLLAPWVGLTFLLTFEHTLALLERFRIYREHGDKTAFIVLAATTAVSIALIYAVEKRARSKK